ncbi:MAG: hypothetical protein L6R39_001989 [Caloplaca ligustica]|nr:MAG: hypothetical protein L6R39_001989 [Caloplaca ligustica]
MPSPSPFFQPSPVASPNSLAILHLKRDLLAPTVLRTYDDENIGYAEGKVATTRYGNYPHSTLIGQPWGSQIKASKVDTGTRGRIGLHTGKGAKRKRGSSASQRGDAAAIGGDHDGQAPDEECVEVKAVKEPVPAETGFCHLLPPTPEIWTASLPHRTQVVYTPDYSYVLQRLRVTPGTEVIEAGAGSGSFSHAAARAVFDGYPMDDAANGNSSHVDEENHAASGRVWSFEFHEQRVQRLQQEVEDHGLSGIVTVTHRDVYQDGFSLPSPTPHSSIRASAVFLDLPAPWLALKHLNREPSSPLNPSTAAYICTFSPCIEQVQRTVSALRSFGWLDIEMVELSARRIESRRERVGLQEEGLRGVNATPATVDEAVGRLREVDGRDRSYHHGMTVKAMNDSLGAASLADGSEDDRRREAEDYLSKQQRLQNIKDAEKHRKLYKEGRLIHRSEPELKMHTSYLVFAVLPRAWKEEDERRAQEDVQRALHEANAGGVSEKPTSKRQRKRAAKEQDHTHAGTEMKWQPDDEDAAFE